MFNNITEGKLQREKLKVSVKPQYIEYDPNKPVEQIIQKIRGSPHFDAQYKKRILRGFNLEDLENRTFAELSGGDFRDPRYDPKRQGMADLFL